MYKQKINWEEELPKLKEMGSTGMTMAEISRHYGVSRQRIKQVVQRHIPSWGDEYGRAVRTAIKQETWRKKWGNKEDTELYKAQRRKFTYKKHQAKYTGYTWTASFGDIDWPTHCPILGLELNWFAENCQENSPSFDRVDSSKGYEPGNVVIVSWRANRIKNNGTAEEHRAIADYIDKMSHR